MKKYIGKRIINFLIVLVGVSILSFLLIAWSGKDPAEIIAHRGVSNPTPEQIEMIRVEMGLDQPLPVRYIQWLSGMFTGELGTSLTTHQPIVKDLHKYLATTTSLVGMAILWIIVLTVPISLLCARKRKGAMDPRFTVYQIIAEPIRNFRKLSKKEEEREINDLLTMMELPEEIKLRKAHELSGGQQKRVCIARALAAQPDVLIFDEAVSGLDVLVRKHILDLLKRLHQERKMTCFFITHDLDVALYLADRVMVMRCGKIIEDRTFHGSTDCFTHPYTKLLLHSIAPYLG